MIIRLQVSCGQDVSVKPDEVERSVKMTSLAAQNNIAMQVSAKLCTCMHT